MKFLSAVVFLFIFNFFEQLLAQQFYRWVDDNGIVHFADSPHSVPERYRRVLEIVLTDRGGSPLGILGMDSLDGFRVHIDHWSNWVEMVREAVPMADTPRSGGKRNFASTGS